MNISGTLNVLRLIRDPSLCLPQHTVSTFNHLPIPLSKAFSKEDGQEQVDIRAVVLDKDNCFAVPHSNEVYKPYEVGYFLSPPFFFVSSSFSVPKRPGSVY
jgi:phosphatidylglycerophosphatase GEP4